MSNIYILWQDQFSKLWHPVAKVSRDNDLYRLNYTRGASASDNFVPFPEMDDLTRVYESGVLFPFFQNRILPSARPEFKKLVSWLDLDPNNMDPLEYLGITGGERKTDNYRTLKLPEPKDGLYTFTFLVSGISYLDELEKKNISNLKSGEELSYSYELDNPIDSNAILLFDQRTEKTVGYCPRYLVADFKKLIDGDGADSCKFKVRKVNEDAPSSYKLVCDFEATRNEDYQPLNFEEYLAYSKG